LPKKTERLRITPPPPLSDADIEHLVQAVQSRWALARAVA
jgi:7-keto-8-aminopelargonate synthetase-like enzyme